MQLSIGPYFTSFISIDVLRLGLNGFVDSDAVFNFRKLKQCRNLQEPFTLFLNCDGSEVVNCNSVVVDRYIVSFDMTGRCFFWKMECAGLVIWDALLGVSSYAV
jgi:hypothetical protein